MSFILQQLANMSKNGIISVNYLQKHNPYLLKLLENNFHNLQKELGEQGIIILNEQELETPEDIKAHLVYHYGNLVNLTTVKLKDRKFYDTLRTLGKPRDVIESFGLEVTYRFTATEREILRRLNQIAEDRTIKKLGYVLHQKVYFRAKKEGLTVQEYLHKLGFSYKDVDYEKIKYLREVKGLTYAEIGNRMGIKPATVPYYYGKIRDNHELSTHNKV